MMSAVVMDPPKVNKLTARTTTNRWLQHWPIEHLPVYLHLPQFRSFNAMPMSLVFQVLLDVVWATSLLCRSVGANTRQTQWPLATTRGIGTSDA